MENQKAEYFWQSLCKFKMYYRASHVAATIFYFIFLFFCIYLFNSEFRFFPVPCLVSGAGSPRIRTLHIRLSYESALHMDVPCFRRGPNQHAYSLCLSCAYAMIRSDLCERGAHVYTSVQVVNHPTSSPLLMSRKIKRMMCLCFRVDTFRVTRIPMHVLHIVIVVAARENQKIPILFSKPASK